MINCRPLTRGVTSHLFQLNCFALDCRCHGLPELDDESMYFYRNSCLPFTSTGLITDLVDMPDISKQWTSTSIYEQTRLTGWALLPIMLSDTTTPHSKWVTLYIIVLLRKSKSCDQELAARVGFCGPPLYARWAPNTHAHWVVSSRVTPYSLYHVTKYLFYNLYCMVVQHRAARI